jgi:hypothetical protein
MCEVIFDVQPVCVCFDGEKVVLNAWSLANWRWGVIVMMKKSDLQPKYGLHLAALIEP